MQDDVETGEMVLERILAGSYRKVMLVGPVDSGKTFFALNAADRLSGAGRRAALLDFDLGQSTVGPPGCVGLQFPWKRDGERLFPTAMVFLGFASPAYDVASVVEAGLRLQKKALEGGCETLLIDTSGMVEGRLATLLKRSKIRALQPDLVVVLEREGEALHIFRGLEEAAYGEIAVMKACPEARRRKREERAAYRRERFREYFRSSRELEIDLGQLEIIATSHRIAASVDALREGRLVGLDDAESCTLSLGRVMEARGAAARLLTPYRGTAEKIARIAIGPALLDPEGNLRIPRT